MTVMTTSPTKSESQNQGLLSKKSPMDKTRPITATLDHPLILDIKLLKKLDMTTFTKKGLIALSKFCGISLINKTDSKRKLNKCIKTIQYSKKQLGTDFGIVLKSSGVESVKKDHLKTKRKPLKQIPRLKPRVRFKVADKVSGQEEDSSDVVCRRHDRTPSQSKPTRGNNAAEKKTIIDGIFNSTMGNVVPEPCKTCNRSEHPERFHSHPKIQTKSTNGKSDKMNLEERFRSSLTTKDSEEECLVKGRKSPSAKVYGNNQISPHKCTSEHQKQKLGLEKIKSDDSPTKSSSSIDCYSSPKTDDGGKKLRKSKKGSVSGSPDPKTNPQVQYLKKTNSTDQKEEGGGEGAMKFVTGCYVCGKQMSPKVRIKHEESCIVEWRAQNSLLSPEKRKPEPKRPDYRFTACGDLDPEGTFESIWANHKDSLVPCKKCGRRFFPDRIERHENCCNNLPVTIKYKH